MQRLNRNDIIAFVENHTGDFHSARLKSLQRLKLKSILKRKNPYLFKAKNIAIASDLVRLLLDAHLSSQEETLFGEFLEALAIFICEKTFGGQKSTTEGIDLAFTRDDILYLVAIKSGPNWGNSSQIKRMKDDFARARRVYRTNNAQNKKIEAVNGCCYGQDDSPDKGDYFKFCGQRFWEFISGDSNLYVEIIEPLGHRAKDRNEEFAASYAGVVNSFTQEFSSEFCAPSGEIDWEALVKFNSAAKR